MFPLSIFQPVHIGIDEFGEQLHGELAERNMLIDGEPAGGKSSAITPGQTAWGHAASLDGFASPPR